MKAEILSTIYTGILWAVMLAWMAFAVQNVGLRVIPVVGLPLLAAWTVGERRGYEKGVRDLKEAMGVKEERR
jgi:hypothetical protein